MYHPHRISFALLFIILLAGCQPGVLYNQPSTGDIRLVGCEHPRSVPLPTRNNRVPIWAPTDNRFAYYGEQFSRADLFIANRDGSGLRNLTRGLAGDPTMDYVWGREGRWLYFTWQNTNDLLSLYRIDTETPGSLPRPLSPLSLNSRHPHVSADNRRVVFASTGPADLNDYDIYTINVDGSNRTLLVRTPGVNDILPSWSADGRIAFVRYTEVIIRQTDGRLLRMPRTFAGLTYALSLNRKSNRIVWSTDNRFIAYEGGGGKIYRVATTPPFTSLCVSCSADVGLHLDRTPEWHDNDEKLVFHRYVNDPEPPGLEVGVVVIDQDGSNEHYLESPGEAPDSGGTPYICF